MSQDIKRLRRENMEICRRMGQPVVLRHMWNRDDVLDGFAKECPACYDAIYEQVRNDCHVCYGVGLVSVEDSLDPYLYIQSDGQVGIDPTSGVRAPRFGGFAQPYLTWMMEPDVSVDVFKLNDQGVMVRTYDAQGTAPWYPKLADNDLCVNVTLDDNGYSVIDTGDRFQLKRTQQITVRGFGKMTRGQEWMVGQTFEMSHIPARANNILEEVPVDPDVPEAT